MPLLREKLKCCYTGQTCQYTLTQRSTCSTRAKELAVMGEARPVKSKEACKGDKLTVRSMEQGDRAEIQ